MNLRSRLGTISGQSSVFFLGTIFTSLVGYLFKIYLARVLGAEALGIYTLGMTVVGFAGIIGALGLPQAAPRFVALYRSTGQSAKLGRFLWHGAAILVLANAAVGMAILAVRHWIGARMHSADSLPPLMAFFVLIMLLGALTTFYGQCLGGYKSVSRRTIITSFIGTSATIVFSIIALQLGFGLRGYLVAQVASAALVLVLLSFDVWKLTPKSARPLPVGLPGLQREVTFFSATLFGIQALEFLGAQADRIVIGVYLNAREVGIYAVAVTLVAFIAILLQSVNQIFAPSIAEVHALGQHDVLVRLYRTLTKWVLGATIPLALVMMIFSRSLMSVFGHDFVEGAPVLIIGAIGQLVNCGTGSVGQLLLMSGNQMRMARTQVIVVPATLILSWFLIPRCGLVGAAIAAAIGTGGMNLLWLKDVDLVLGVHPLRKMYVSLIPGSIVSALSILGARYLLRSVDFLPLTIAAACVVGFASFAICSTLLGFDADDKALAAATWERFRERLSWRSHELTSGCAQ